MEWITLEGGAEVFFYETDGKCKSCDAVLMWGITKNNEWIPVVQDENGKFLSHFAGCPGAAEHRKRHSPKPCL
mgnify:FL=1